MPTNRAMKRSLLILAAGLFGMLSNARGDGFIVVERPFLVRPGHFPFAPLEVTSHHVEVKIDSQVAVTSIDQEFYNPNDQRLEGTYMFPVPKGAHIDKFSMEIGGKMVDAELLPAEKARQIYEEIVRKMRDPALLEYAGRDLFKVRIFPIEPRSRKPIKISYTELLRSDAGTVTYSYPLSTEKFSAQLIKSLSVKVEVKSEQPLASIYSPSHKVEIKRDGANRAVIGYESKDEKPETDFQLVYNSEARDVGLSLITHKPAGEDGYFLILAAPTMAKETKPAPKDVVFVVDTSGSMAGAKLQQAKKALEFCVENLNGEDRFEIVRFSTEAEPLFGKLVDADSEHRKRASNFIADLKPIGGTAIADALQSALKARTEKTDRPFVIIFLTDGLPTVGTRNSDEIVAEVKKAGDARIFSFGIGSDVNTQLLDQIAEVVTGRYTGSGEVEAKLTGMANGREQTFNYKVKFNDSSNDYVARLWATRRVGFLLDEIRIHGETSELRDEATDLARRFGIVTPYTAYLIVEDEDRRRVPMTERSMQSMSADSAARAGVAKAWDGFKEKKDGDDAVANARSQNAFKFADQSAASIYAGAEESLRGFALSAPAARAESDRLTQYTQQSKFVNGRAFFQNGKQWVDAKAQNATRRERIQFNSEAYFDLLKKHPEAAPWMALGQNVLLSLDDTVYEITD